MLLVNHCNEPSLMYYEFWIALSDAKIEEVIYSTKSIKNKLLIGFLNDAWRNLIFWNLWNMNWIIFDYQVYIVSKNEKNLFETRNKVNLNTFLISAIKFSWEDNRSYKEKTKRSMINNNKLNLLLLKWIIDKIHLEICRSWSLSSTEKTLKKLKWFNIEF